MVEVKVMKDVVYGQGGGRDLRLDCYEPGSDRMSTAVILIHGGGWSRGERGQLADHARFLANEGFTALSMEYRLTGESAFPGMLHDVKAAIRWVRKNAAMLQIDPANICLQGHSAGAHLALLAAGTPNDPRFDAPNVDISISTTVAAVAAVYPPVRFHLGDDRPSGSLPARVLLGDTATAEMAELASPINHVTPNFPPTFLTHGDTDKVVPFSASLRMWETLRAAGVPVDAQLHAGLPHGFASMPEVLPALMASTSAFFRRHVAQKEQFQAALAARAAATAPAAPAR
jgi:acetyl esterase/lipase